jgi:indole-3-glycerol phosphate synthase
MRALALNSPEPKAMAFDRFDLIAEVKRTSPSQGVLATADSDIVALARSYADAGAAMISVLTEPSRFGGSLEDLRAIAAAVDVPAMRKDFLVDAYQVYEARAWGASAVLLIARMLDDGSLSRMLDACHSAGLTVLLEAFDAPDLNRSARMIEHRSNVLLGLNCRDLATLQEDTASFESLASAFPEGRVRIAESGIATADDPAKVARLGYDGALVGTALMRSSDPGALARAMIHAGRAALA